MSDMYDDPRAHARRERYHAVFGGGDVPVPVWFSEAQVMAVLDEIRDATFDLTATSGRLI